MAKKTKAQLLVQFKAKQARELAQYKKSLQKKSVRRRREVVKSLKEIKRLKAKAPSKTLKIKAAKRTRRAAVALGRAARKPFAGGLTQQVAKGYRAVKEFFARRPRTLKEKEKTLAKIGVKPFKRYRKRTEKQKRLISRLYSEFAEFTGRARHKFVIIHTAKKETLERARKSGMAVYGEHIYVHVAQRGETARLKHYMGETIIARTYYGKLERIFLGGASVFNRVVKKLETKKLPHGTFITGAFFGGPTFHKAIFETVGELVNYITNTFKPHLPQGVRPTKRNIAEAKKDLIKNIALVTIESDIGEEETE